MKVRFIPNDDIDRDDENWSEHVDHWVAHGEMTTGHPASSYGLPVIVRDGIAYGPADIYNGDYSGVVGESRDHAMEAAAAAAGYHFEPNQSTSDTTY